MANVDFPGSKRPWQTDSRLAIITAIAFGKAAQATDYAKCVTFMLFLIYNVTHAAT